LHFNFAFEERRLYSARSLETGKLSNLDDQIFFLPFSHAQFIAVIKIGNSNFLINGFYLPVIDVNAALFNEAPGFRYG
jgi:hypothetical protein